MNDILRSVQWVCNNKVTHRRDDSDTERNGYKLMTFEFEQNLGTKQQTFCMDGSLNGGEGFNDRRQIRPRAADDCLALFSVTFQNRYVDDY